MNKAVKIIGYLSKRLLALLLVVALCVCGFFVSMNISNMYVLITDGFKARSDYIMYGTGEAELDKFFSAYYLSMGDYRDQRLVYKDYDITSYGQKVENSSLWTWPWQTTKVLYVNEAIYSIYGEISPAVMSRNDALLSGKLRPPAYTGTRYRVTLVSKDGAWKIDSVEPDGVFDYVPPISQSLAPDVLDALRPTPTPVPTQTPLPSGQTPAPTPVPTPTAALKKARVIAKNNVSQVNLREGPGTSYAVLAVLNVGDELSVLAEQNGWLKVKVTAGGKEGYVSASYVAFEED